MTQIPIANGYYKDYSLTVSSQQCSGWWPVYPDTQAVSAGVLYPSPGIISQVNLGATELRRGQIEFDDKLYTVNNQTLYRIDRTLVDGVPVYAETALGKINLSTTGLSPVSMAHNPTQLCIVVPGEFIFIFTEEDGIQDVTQIFLDAYDGVTGLELPNAVVYWDSFFVFTSSRHIFASDSNDGTSYNALSFGTAEMDPDRIIAPFVYRNQVYIFGSQLTEVYDNNPDFTLPFPLLRNEGYVLDKGLSSQFAIVESEESFMFVGGSNEEIPGVWRVEQGTPVKISTPAIDLIIENLSLEQLQKVNAFAYSLQGGFFAVFDFGEITLIHDITASRKSGVHTWHQHGSRENFMEAHWHVGGITKVYGTLITTSDDSGVIGELSMDEFEDEGTTIVRTMSSPTVFSNGDPIYVDQIEITIESGTSPLGEDLDLTLSTSKDGGKTWGNQRRRKIGTRGNGRQRLVWRRVGRFNRFFNFRLQFSGNAKMVIIRADVKFAGLDFEVAA